jgi:hypothetical protein
LRESYGPTTLTWQCFACQLSYTFTTQPQERCQGEQFASKGRGYKQAALTHVLSVAVSNFVYDKYHTYRILNGLLPVPETTYDRTANNLIWPTIINIADQLMAEARQRAIDRDLPLILCLDGGWAHRGFHSKQACLPVIDFWTGDVLYLYTAEHGRKIRLRCGRIIEINGTNPRTSKGAECYMMEEMLADLSMNPQLMAKLFAFVIDSDSSAYSCVRNFPHDISQTKIFFDTGHAKKALAKSVAEIVGV